MAVRAILVATAMIVTQRAAADPPPFKVTRYDEDYSYLASTPQATDLANRYKYIPLGDAAYLSLGGELRERFDRIDSPKFGIGATSDSYVLQRVLLHADLHLADDRVRGFVQIGREDAFGKAGTKSPSDADRVDVQNAFLDLRPDATGPATLRIGRQELMLNAAQRFVSVREGPNVRQSFDGVRFTWSEPRLRLDAFTTRPVNYRPGSFDDSTDNSQRFSGVYASFALDKSQSLDGYALRLERDAARYGSVAGTERRDSWGVRWAGSSGPVDHDVEAIYQTGHVADSTVRAWALGAIAGYTFAMAGAPRAGLELDVGSGDRDASDHRVETFNPLFPKGAYFNESALTSWANLVMLRSSISFKPTRQTSLSMGVFERWRQSGSDAVYLQPAVPLASTLNNRERRVGTGLQLDGTWRINRYASLQAQVVHQEAGPAIRAAGGHTLDFAMVIAQLRF